MKFVYSSICHNEEYVSPFIGFKRWLSKVTYINHNQSYPIKWYIQNLLQSPKYISDISIYLREIFKLDLTCNLTIGGLDALTMKYLQFLHHPVVEEESLLCKEVATKVHTEYSMCRRFYVWTDLHYFSGQLWLDQLPKRYGFPSKETLLYQYNVRIIFQMLLA